MTKYKNKISTQLIFTAVILLVGSFLFIRFNQETKHGISSTQKPTLEINDVKIDLEIADTFEAQRQGLSDREELANNTGMLFVWEEKQIKNFWMKNMHFPLDIIWIDGNKIVHISENLPPEGEMPQNHYSSIVPVNNVLEVNAGFCAEHDIKIGDEVKFNM